MALDCRTCGACCVSDWDQPHYVSLGADDARRLSRRSRRLHVVEVTPSGMAYSDVARALATKHDAQDNCVCIALRGTVGQRATCGIYARRPYACRRFTVGGEGCQYARHVAGIAPQQRFVDVA